MAQLFVKVEMTTYVRDEHMEFMEMLQNPTKHMSRVEKRKEQLKSIGVAIDDIVEQEAEDAEIDNKKAKKKPEPARKSEARIGKNDPKTTFAAFGFQVLKLLCISRNSAKARGSISKKVHHFILLIRWLLNGDFFVNRGRCR
jgi:hypothetical protein